MGKGLLIIVVGFASIFGTMMLNQTDHILGSGEKIIAQYVNTVRTNVAESITNVAISKIHQDINWVAGINSIDFSDAHGSVVVTDVTADSSSEARKIELKVITDFGNVSDTTVTTYIQPAYSYYSFFLNNIWPNTLSYNTGDTLTGPIHANPRIRIKGDPVFLSKLSSQDANFHAVLGGDDPRFYGGVEFGTPAIPLPDLAPLTAVGMASGHRFTDELWLRFKADGTYDYSTDAWVTTLFESIGTYNGIILTEPGTAKDIHVEGTLNGRITVLSDRDILVEDNIVYLSDPIANPASNDYLGLVARHRVTIVENVPNSTDVTIHAAIIAHHDEINIPNFATGGPWGTLQIVGSLVENDFQPYGTGPGTTGYVISHIHDPRLIDKTPPFFPRLTSRLELFARSK